MKWEEMHHSQLQAHQGAAYAEYQAAQNVFAWSKRPSVYLRPSLGLDGNQWCALYGPNLMEGVAGFGDTPDDALRAFDEAMQTGAPGSPTALEVTA